MSSFETASNLTAFRIAPASKYLGRFGGGRQNIPPYELVWWFFAACIILGNIRTFAGEVTGLLNYVIAFGGSAGCAWAWLFARTLFRPKPALTPWPVLLLSATILVEGVWEVTHGLTTTGVAGETQRLVANAASFLCIAMLALVFVEALSGFNRQMPAIERRFRQIFIGFFSLALVVTMLWALGAPEGTLAAQSQIPAQVAFGLLAVVGGRFAIEFRRKHSLASSLSAYRKKPRAQSIIHPASADLADRIRSALEHEQLFATPKLKVSDLSALLGEPEYKITQCITGVMGYPNFNRLVNDYRIANAKAVLGDHEKCDRQILTIALDCGFNSIGPFNRAFKQEVGMTPREYRAAEQI